MRRRRVLLISYLSLMAVPAAFSQSSLTTEKAKLDASLDAASQKCASEKIHALNLDLKNLTASWDNGQGAIEDKFRSFVRFRLDLYTESSKTKDVESPECQAAQIASWSAMTDYFVAADAIYHPNFNREQPHPSASPPKPPATPKAIRPKLLTGGIAKKDVHAAPKLPAPKPKFSAQKTLRDLPTPALLKTAIAKADPQAACLKKRKGVETITFTPAGELLPWTKKIEYRLEAPPKVETTVTRASPDGKISTFNRPLPPGYYEEHMTVSPGARGSAGVDFNFRGSLGDSWTSATGPVGGAPFLIKLDATTMLEEAIADLQYFRIKGIDSALPIDKRLSSSQLASIDCALYRMNRQLKALRQFENQMRDGTPLEPGHSVEIPKPTAH